MNATTTPQPRSIVPAFFVVAQPAEAATDMAAHACMYWNKAIEDEFVERNSLAPPICLRLCEASPTTEFDEGDEIPHTLEGYTCDSGSDRSAAGLIRAIADHARAVENGTPAELTASVLAAFGRIQQLAEGWLRQRMALHPTAPSVQAAEARESQDAATLLLHAYARGEASGGSIDWDELNTAFIQAKAEHPGAYEQILSMHEGQQA
jgi:hypothetical protein